MVLRQDPERLYQACTGLPYARALFDRWRKEPLPEDNFERAVRWFYLNRSCISGDMRYPRWKHSKKKENPASYYQSACELIPKVAKRLARVQIECLDFWFISTYSYRRPWAKLCSESSFFVGDKWMCYSVISYLVSSKNDLAPELDSFSFAMSKSFLNLLPFLIFNTTSPIIESICDSSFEDKSLNL